MSKRHGSRFRPVVCVLFVAVLAGARPVAAVPAEVAGMPAYVGNERCSMCHRAQYQDWQRSKHARAFEVLKAGSHRVDKRKAGLDPERDYTAAPECLRCHTTGYGLEGGFVSLSATPEQAGVGCEECHGPGERYREIHKAARGAIDRTGLIAAGQRFPSVSDAAACRSCHDHEDSPFNADLDPKHAFDARDRLADVRSFHRIYRHDPERP